MVNRVDGVILGVGVVVLVASVIGVILYDEDSPETFTVSWTQSEATELDQQTDSGGPGEYPFETNLSQTALARTEFSVEVSFSGANVQQDTVDVEVATPEGNADTCSFNLAQGQTSGTGSCTVEVGVSGSPNVTSVTATNATDAREVALEEANISGGQGTWATTVTIDGGEELSDPDYEITLTPTVFTWQATATAPGPSGRAG